MGSVTGIDRSHLKRLQSLIDRIHPILVSGHLAWSTYGNDYLNDLLFYALTMAALNVFLLYLAKCTISATEVRVALTRACFAAERLRRI